MKAPFLTALVTAAAASALAGTCTLELKDLQLGSGVSQQEPKGKLTLKIDHSQGASQSSELLFNLEKPVIRNQSYAIVGEVRYQAMPPESFLELWNHFPAEKEGSEVGASFFSRTMGESGPMGKLSGDSDWRPFQLPFFMDDGSKRLPLKLTFNVQFQGAGGIVEIRNLHLIDGLGKRAAVQDFSPGSLLAIGFTAGAAAATTVAVICWRISSARTQRELRRIQSVDV